MQNETTQSAAETKPQENQHWILLIIFWVYVLIPLAWGVTQTIKKAMALFV
jgi:hypothetical protein